jgi:hypothetical protein
MCMYGAVGVVPPEHHPHRSKGIWHIQATSSREKNEARNADRQVFQEVNVQDRIHSGGGFQSVWGIYAVLSGELKRLWIIHIGAQRF